MNSQLNLERTKDKGTQEEILLRESRKENETGRDLRTSSFVNVRIILEFWLDSNQRHLNMVENTGPLYPDTLELTQFSYILILK